MSLFGRYQSHGLLVMACLPGGVIILSVATQAVLSQLSAYEDWNEYYR